MAYPLLTSYNVTVGLEAPLCYVNSVTGGMFMPLILVGIWVIFAVGGYFMQRNMLGKGDFPQTTAVAGFVCSVFAILMRIVEYDGVHCLIDPTTLSVVLFVTGISILFFLFSRD